MPVNHYTSYSFAEILDDLATLSPILLIICIYYATCLWTGFLGPHDEAISEVTVLVLWCESVSSLYLLFSTGFCSYALF